MKYYLISGEASGDLHGSHLIHALKKQDPKAVFRAWGGDLIQQEGAVVVKHYKDLAFMGFWEVLSNLPTLIRNIAFCKKDILQFKPDVIIYVDYPGFNLRIANWAKKKGFKNHYYISPQVWAWKENRVQQMKRCLDALYVILPFEKAFFEEKHQFPVHFVGHPLQDQLSLFKEEQDFFKTHALDPKTPIIALLPGSRKQEIRKMLPLFVQVASHFKAYQFVIAGAPGISSEYYDSFLENASVKILHSHTIGLLKKSKAALVTSGTATLETALLGVPQLVCYKSNPINYWIGKKIVKLKHISLVNLILDRTAVTELIQEECNLENLNEHLDTLLKKSSLDKIQEEYLDLKKQLGDPGASEKTAALIYKAIS